jgi:hypothetical protein
MTHCGLKILNHDAVPTVRVLPTTRPALRRIDNMQTAPSSTATNSCPFVTPITLIDATQQPIPPLRSSNEHTDHQYCVQKSPRTLARLTEAALAKAKRYQSAFYNANKKIKRTSLKVREMLAEVALYSVPAYGLLSFTCYRVIIYMLHGKLIIFFQFTDHNCC